MLFWFFLTQMLRTYITFIIDGGRESIAFLKTCKQIKISKNIQLLSLRSRKYDSYLG